MRVDISEDFAAPTRKVWRFSLFHYSYSVVITKSLRSDYFSRIMAFRKSSKVRSKYLTIYKMYCTKKTPCNARVFLVFFLQFRSRAKDKFLRRTHRFICAMNATDPAARTTVAFGKFVLHDFDPALARFRFFRVFYPADPFVARQGGDVFPNGEHVRFFGKKRPHVGRRLVDSSV